MNESPSAPPDAPARSPRRGGWAIAVAAGVCWGVDAPPGLDLFLWFFGAALALRIPERQALHHGLLGALAGIAAGVAQFAWAADAWARFAATDGTAAVGLLAVMEALPHAVAWALAAAGRPRTPAQRVVAWCLAYFVAETLVRELHPVPAGLSLRFFEYPALAAPAAWLGAPALSALCFAVAAATRARPAAGVALLGAWLLCAPVADDLDFEAVTHLALVQPDFEAFDTRRASTAEHRRHRLEALFAEADHRSPDLIVTPEGAWPHDPGAPGDHRWNRLVREWSVSTPVLLGVESEGANRLLHVERGSARPVFDKRFLAPIAERRWLGLGRDRFRPGQLPREVGVHQGILGVAICYEDLLPATARELHHADAIVISTNDAWLGPEGMRFHLRAARRLAVETRRWVARATTNGVTTFIDPLGRLVSGETLHPATGGSVHLYRVPVRPRHRVSEVYSHLIAFLGLTGFAWRAFTVARDRR